MEGLRCVLPPHSHLEIESWERILLHPKELCVIGGHLNHEPGEMLHEQGFPGICLSFLEDTDSWETLEKGRRESGFSQEGWLVCL